MASAPDERAFAIFEVGIIRDEVVLATFRDALRSLTNPDTGAAFTEDEIQRATQPGSRFYIEADAIDLVGQVLQGRALTFVDQIDPRRANTVFLEEHHAQLWLADEPRLPAVGGSGDVAATGTAATVVPGSTTLGDPTALVGTDPNGRRFQNLATEVIPAGGALTLTLRGIDTGTVTNLTPGTIITWSDNVPLGLDPQASVSVQFEGGFDEESDEELQARVVDRIRNRPASGNASHFRAWAREASTAVEAGFVYACALHAGTTVVAITQKRGVTQSGGPLGPEARIPSLGALTDVSNYLTPPQSPVVPERVFVLVVSPAPQQSDLVVRVSMGLGTIGGWADSTPWPAYSAGYPTPQITAVTSPTAFTMQVDAGSLPGGAASLTAPDAPQLMIWNREQSRFVKLDVSSITDVGGDDFDVVLATAPDLVDDALAPRNVAVGDRISPDTEQRDTFALALEEYFDTLGPGEVVAESDIRFARAARAPRPSDQSTIRAGQAIISTLIDALGGFASDAELTSISKNEPDLPPDIVDGPNMIVLGHVNVSPL